MKREDNLLTALRSAGFRATRQRIALLTLLERRHTASIEDITRAGKGAFDTATAYRMLEAFEKKGLVERVGLDAGKVLYELPRKHHHHAVCTKCGVIVDISACIPPSLALRARRAARFASLGHHRLEFFGICASCAKKI